MVIPDDSRYLCTMNGTTLHVHGVASLDMLRDGSISYDWTCAFTQSYMDKIVSAGDVNVVWFQKEFDFDS